MFMPMGTRLNKAKIMKGITGAVEVKKLHSNTVRYRDGKSLIIRLFNTNIITSTPKYIMLDSGGHRTNLTKNRINQYQSLCYVTQKNYNWFVYVVKTQKKHIFMDGMKIYHTGKVELLKFLF